MDLSVKPTVNAETLSAVFSSLLTSSPCSIAQSKVGPMETPQKYSERPTLPEMFADKKAESHKIIPFPISSNQLIQLISDSASKPVQLVHKSPHVIQAALVSHGLPSPVMEASQLQE